jgi:hypothetical protein
MAAKKIKDPFHRLIAQQDLSGRAVVTHLPQLAQPPKHIRPDCDHYYENVVDGESQKIPNQGNPGASPKICVSTEDGTKYMVKPYHEGIHPRAAPYMRYPTQGWSEVATNALYHAGGVGHLCSRSHVSMHKDMHHKLHPVVATKLDEHANLSIDHMAGYQGPAPQELMKRAFVVGMMDFLTNHNDRHEHNLLFEPSELGAPDNLLAVDNGSAFQYKVPNRFDRMFDNTDNLYYYIADSRGMKYLTNPHEGRFLWSSPYIKHGVEWWKDQGGKVRQEMDKQLGAIVHPAVREYIRDNFHQRAAALDRLAKMHSSEVDPDSYDPYVDGDNSHALTVPILKFHPR